jgi:hypothetical protein
VSNVQIEKSFLKGDDEALDYQINWANVLGTDTIATSNWSVEAGLTSVSTSNTTTTATLWVSGGTAGTEYACENTVVTAGGRTHQRTIGIRVVDR